MTWRSTAHIPKTAAEARLLQGFTQTDEMRAADEAVRNSTPETEPEKLDKDCQLRVDLYGAVEDRNNCYQGGDL